MNYPTKSLMASHRSFIMLVLGLLLSGFLPLYGQTFPDRPSGHVNDHGGFLTPEQVRSLETKLRTYRDTTSNVIVIATLPDLRWRRHRGNRQAMFNTWRMWEGDRQNGVLILASRQERALRIESVMAGRRCTRLPGRENRARDSDPGISVGQFL